MIKQLRQRVDTNVTFTNTRGGVIPTGVIITVAPFAALMLVGIAGAAVILKKKSKDLSPLRFSLGIKQQSPGYAGGNTYL